MSYYTGFKKIRLDGVPCRVAPWHGELGNDPEALEAIRPRTSFKAAYYEGGYRLMRDGVACRLAGHVAALSPRARAMLHLKTAGGKEDRELERQAKALGLCSIEKQPA